MRPLQDAIAHRYGTHRVVDPKVTAARIVPRSTGYHASADVTGLDYLGVPVTMVVRPASRNLSVVKKG
jgi:ribosomal protein S12 methylthiotransferase accessory factor YcaO